MRSRSRSLSRSGERERFLSSFTGDASRSFLSASSPAICREGSERGSGGAEGARRAGREFGLKGGDPREGTEGPQEGVGRTERRPRGKGEMLKNPGREQANAKKKQGELGNPGRVKGTLRREWGGLGDSREGPQEKVGRAEGPRRENAEKGGTPKGHRKAGGWGREGLRDPKRAQGSRGVGARRPEGSPERAPGRPGEAAQGRSRPCPWCPVPGLCLVPWHQRCPGPGPRGGSPVFLQCPRSLPPLSAHRRSSGFSAAAPPPCLPGPQGMPGRCGTTAPGSPRVTGLQLPASPARSQHRRVP